jgi:hypothetical protein
MKVTTTVELTHQYDRETTEEVIVSCDLSVDPNDPNDTTEGEYFSEPTPWCFLSADHKQQCKEALWVLFNHHVDAEKRAHALDNPPARHVEPSLSSGVRPVLRLIRGGLADGGLADVEAALDRVNRSTAKALGLPVPPLPADFYRPTWSAEIVKQKVKEALDACAAANKSIRGEQ